MKIMVLEPTNRCNLSCRHCFRNRADPREDLPIETVEHILRQAKPLGIFEVRLTGGEVALYPQLRELLDKIVDLDFYLNLVSNGYEFEENILPLLLEPKVKARLNSVSLSLDGATAAAHDALRGKNSFAEVSWAALLCKRHHLPLTLKSAITNLNKNQLAQLAKVGAQLNAETHSFLFLMPTPALIRENLLPSPGELNRIARWVRKNLAGKFTSKITVEGFVQEGPLLNCDTVMNFLNVDYQGNLILCCQLSHVTMGDGIPTQFKGELVADLKQVPLREGIIRQYRLAAKLMEDKLESHGNPPGLSQTPCHWCLYHFGKLEWLKDFHDSSWAQELLPNC